MSGLKAIHDKQEEIPETYRELYTEKDGKWELTGIEGVKTPQDVARVQASLDKERKDHKDAKAKLAEWDGWNKEEVQGKLDRIEELEAAAAGKLDEAKIDELANKRAEGISKTKVAPLERQIRGLEKERDELKESNGSLTEVVHRREREDVVRPVMRELKIVPEHEDDVLLYAERHLQRGDDGSYSVRDGLNGLTPGATPKDWLTELAAKRPGWLPGSRGGPGRPGSGPLGGGISGDNPWGADHWNKTKQAQFVREHGKEKAEQAARSAGSSLHAIEPPKPKG